MRASEVVASCLNCGARVELIGAEDRRALVAQGWTELERISLRPIFRGRCPKCSVEDAPA